MLDLLLIVGTTILCHNWEFYDCSSAEHHLQVVLKDHEEPDELDCWTMLWTQETGNVCLQ